MNKNRSTNIIAFIVMIGGYYSPVYSNIIFTTGLFSLAGGVTNWLAVYMLFDKIPLIYGSGVIPNRFEDFKIGIKRLIVQEFFTEERVKNFFQEYENILSPENIANKVDYDQIFEHLKDGIVESSFGGMLAMVGGKSALNVLKEPIIEKLKLVVGDVIDNIKTDNISENITTDLLEKIESIIDTRLNELTPQMVKEIVQDMIRHHLGWLVVWGGVFGGLIGLITSILNTSISLF
ncbi:MAG: DUF445 domain-containing protein [Dehalococcoidia bacterium]|tara:strand:- start:3 stop:704 length:702 start_codon:yes stop_codon:yes gene_type:complete